MNRRSLRKFALLVLCLAVTVVGCSTAKPKPRSATFDGDMRLVDEAKDFYSRHRVVTLNGHNLYKRVEVRDEKIKCEFRDCRLQPGQHTIDVEYFWSSLEAEKKRNKKEGGQILLFLIAIFGGVPGDLPNPRTYPCHVSIFFEVQSGHDYVLHVVHTDKSDVPEEFQVVDTESGALAGSARPSC